MKHLYILLFILPCLLSAQSDLPLEVKITDGHLIYGDNAVEGFYNPEIVNKIELTLTENNWFRLLDGSPGPNGNQGESLVGTLTYNDDIILDSVLISIKGQTSDFMNNSEKKSFKVEIDELKNQDLLGYDNLNLNCGFQDESGMREVLYYDISRAFTPSLKGALIDLYINGEYWGPYNNIQQIEGTYIKEWFNDNDGTRWRAVIPDDVGGGGPGGPGGNPFGTGSSTLNYNGPDTTDYNEDYTLKKTSKENPWEDLIDVCDELNATPIEDLYETLNPIFDIDRALWILAQEIIFSDDDSYIYKGGMDYYVYWDHATGRLMNLEVDGNSVMINDNVDWDIFYNENDTRFPLLNRMLQNTEIRQRYLAHVRTILSEHFIVSDIHERIDEFAAKLDQRVQDDPKKIYNYNRYLDGVEDLKDFITDRHQFITQDNEVNRSGLTIGEVTWSSDNGVSVAPSPYTDVNVTAALSGGDIREAKLYYGEGTDGAFDRINMFDDGAHGDGIAGDGVYGADIPGYAANTYVRYYIEAIQDDGFNTASYMPSGAEHNVFIYQVAKAPVVEGDIVINELMADNETTATDGEGKFEDWVELYNKGTQVVDLTGYYLSDDPADILKWQFPDNTTLAPDEYLIIWADDDPSQTTDTEIHTNFKLSNNGEFVLLVNANEEIEDQIEFGELSDDVAFARFENGTGAFERRTPTFAANNNGSLSNNNELDSALDLVVYPNPFQETLYIKGLGEIDNATINVLSIYGSVLVSQYYEAGSALVSLDLPDLHAGMYILQVSNGNKVLHTQQVSLIK